MKYFFCMVTAVTFFLVGYSQSYFPPNNSDEWVSADPASLGWCSHKIDSLYRFLDSNSTNAFILLKDGKIVLEKYFGNQTAESSWYWASAGKTIAAVLTGIAQQEGYLHIQDTTSKYLGEGWTSLLPEQEEKITIRHQLTMTTGLDDGVEDVSCTADTCLQFLVDAGERWAYHNEPYTLLDKVIENATGYNVNNYFNQKVKSIIGMDGYFIPVENDNVFFSTARSMARYGLLMLNEGNWNGTQVITDSIYFHDMISTSQNLNESYGYLWWLNGKDSLMIPRSQFIFRTSVSPNAPADMYAALGRNGQFINVVPSQNMVWIRMGDIPDNTLVPFRFNDDIWEHINSLYCDQGDSTHQTIRLEEGWNLISTCIETEQNSIDSIFKGLDVEMIKTMSEFWSVTQPKYLNSLQNINPATGYFVLMKESSELTISGILCSDTLNTGLFDSGWQLLGSPFQTSVPFHELFTNEDVEVIKNFDGFWHPEGDDNGIFNLDSGKGYFVKGTIEPQ